MSIYIRCLRCYSENLSIAGSAPYEDRDIATCLNCGASVSYGELGAANIERISEGVRGGKPDPTGLN
jgi:transcription elongation factor Elf1